MKSWRVVRNGQLPGEAKFAKLDEAISYVSNKTGVTAERVRMNFQAGCPTLLERNDAEFDIEEAS